MPNLFKRAGGWKWLPDSDSVGAPDEALLRAHNTVPDEIGGRALRGGSSELYTSLGTRVDSLRTATLQKTTYRYAGVDDELVINGASSGKTFDGSGDITFGDDSYQAFAARGTKKWKHDGSTTNTWGIAKPTKKPTLAAVTRVTKEVASFDSDELPAFVINEGSAGTPQFITDYDGTANGAMQVEPDAESGIASVTKYYNTEQDFLNLQGFQGAETDVFDMRVWLENPRQVEKVTIMFGLDDPKSDSASITMTSSSTTATVTHSSHPLSDGDVVVITGATNSEFNGVFSITYINANSYSYTMSSATTPPGESDSGTVTYVTKDAFRDNHYFFDFNIRNNGKIDNKDAASSSVEAYRKSTNRLLEQLTADEITEVKTPEDAGQILKRLGGSYRGSTVQARADGTAASPAWGHFSVTRGQFKRIGDSDADWNDVTAFKVVYHAVPGEDTSKKKFGMDDAVWAGSGNRSLTGKFQAAYRYARRFKDDDGDLVYTELSPMSPLSDPITLKQQTLNVTITEAGLSGADPQVDTIWIYIFGGWLDTFYRAAVTASSINQGLTIDELTNPGAGAANFDDAIQRSRLTTHGFTYVQTGTETSLSAGELTSSSTTATVTHTNTLSAGDYVLISWAAQSEYNGVYLVDSATGSDFTYTFAGSATSPATAGGGDPSNPGVITFTPLAGYPTGTPTGAASNDLTVSIAKSEIDLMIENEIFEPGSIGPPDDIVGIAGPWNRRMFVLTKKGWLYPSSTKSPSSFSLYHAIDLRRYGEPLWLAGTANGVIAGCSKDIIRIAGTGDESADHVTVDLFPQPFSAGNPPVDKALAVDSNVIIYRAADGPMMLVGNTFQMIPFIGTELLWRGYNRHGVEALDIENGRFRFATDNHNLYMLAPEGVESETSVTITRSETTATVTHTEHGFSNGDKVRIKGASDSYYNGDHIIMVVDDDSYTFTVNGGAENPATGSIKAVLIKDPVAVWKYYQAQQEWCRLTYGYTINSITREPDGNVILGTKSGEVLRAELGDEDNSEAIAVDILTPINDGGNPLARKDPSDFQIHCYTADDSGTASFYINGLTEPVASVTQTFATGANEVYRTDLTGLGKFLKLQLGITGSFRQFSMNAFNVTYRPLPQQVMVYDTGHIIAPRQDLAWINEVEIDVESPADLEMEIWKNGSLWQTLDVPVTANIRDVYTIVCPRQTKGRRLRLVFKTTNSNGEGNVGFEPYGIAVRFRGSGNFTELPLTQGDQGNV